MRREALSPDHSAWILALVVLVYGLLLWIISVFTIANYEFARLREFWSFRSGFGLSIFQIVVLANLLFAALIVLSAARRWRAQGSRSWRLMITYAASLSIVAAWSLNFYGMATIPLNDAWYYEAISDEPFDEYRIHLGQVVSSTPCADCLEGEAVLSVRLETREDVNVTALAAENPVGSIVSIQELRGRYTASRRHEHYMPVGADDPALFKKRWFQQPLE